MKVTFIGHRDAPSNIYPLIRKRVIDLIENYNANTFYIGTHGFFDKMVHLVMKDIKTLYPQIIVYSVLAYMPRNAQNACFDLFDTILPEEVAISIPRFAIWKRNLWMIDNSEALITYIRRSGGIAAKVRKIAVGKNIKIIDI